MLVTIKLNEANYPSWSKFMIHALTTKNRLGFTDNTIQYLQKMNNQQNLLYRMSARVNFITANPL